MNDDTFGMIAAAVVALCQIYEMNGSQFPLLAVVWDIIARIAGIIAWITGRIAMNARLNYFMVVNSGY